MRTPKRRSSGMTLIEMLAAITILMMLTAILAQVFLQASRAAAKGKALAEIYQVSRALRGVLAKDLAGCTTDFFESRENGLVVNGSGAVIYGLPPGPYDAKQYGVGLADDEMLRMLAGGSDYLVFTSGTASGVDKAVCKVYYVLRDKGELVRVTHADTSFTDMDYVYDAIENPPSMYASDFDADNPVHMNAYEETRVLAENVQRIKFRFLDMGDGPIGPNAQDYATGVWVDRWEWDEKSYLPAAVKVEMQLVDHLWNLQDDDALTNRYFDPTVTANELRASEMFDPEDGEPFTFVINIPLGTRASGG